MKVGNGLKFTLSLYLEELKKLNDKKGWFVYMLRSSDNKKTYFGMTNNILRRIRQHNGIIKRGARYTKTGRPWFPMLVATGVRTRQNAASLEWYCKHPRTNKGRGLARRSSSMIEAIMSRKWMKTRYNRIDLYWFLNQTVQEKLMLDEIHKIHDLYTNTALHMG